MPWPPLTNSSGVSSGRPSLCCKMDTLTCSGTSRCATDRRQSYILVFTLLTAGYEVKNYLTEGLNQIKRFNFSLCDKILISRIES